VQAECVVRRGAGRLSVDDTLAGFSQPGGWDPPV